jgi:mannitol/fructose-specific phosphotransferase system IIA component (Ntr-type)
LPLPIRPELVFMDLRGAHPEQALGDLSRRLAETGAVPSAAVLTQALVARERLGSTAVGTGVAIPHAKVAGIRRPLLAVGIAPGGVDFAAADGELVRLLFVIVSPPDAPAEHLRMLAQISRWLGRGAACVRALLEAGSREAVAALLQESTP